MFADEEGNAAYGMPVTLVTLTFVEHEGKTKFIMRSRFASVEGLQQVMEMGVVQGCATTSTTFWKSFRNCGKKVYVLFNNSCHMNLTNAILT